MARRELVPLVFVLSFFVCEITSSSLNNITLQVDNILRILDPINFEVNAKIIYHPDYNLTTTELVNKYGYKGEIHHVTTNDGYILEVHRVNSMKNTSTHNPDNETNMFTPQKPVILIMHGILCSSADWVLAGPKRGLAYILADQGFDVWLGNARGNKYSRNHTYLSLDLRVYWDFSVHEIGKYDIPSLIDYITTLTSNQQIYYLGHSQGTVAFNIMASEMPHYNKLIKTAIFLAPVGHMRHMRSPVFQTLAHMAKSIAKVMALFNQYSFSPSSMIMKTFKSMLCDRKSITQPICSLVICEICGYSKAQVDKNLIGMIMNHIPAGASIKQFLHFAQIHLAGRFQKYDYGRFVNKMKYKSLTPPLYNLSKINVDTHWFYSDSDWVATPQDTLELSVEIARNKLYHVPLAEFNHLDFLWGHDVKTLVYDRILQILNQYRNVQ